MYVETYETSSEKIYFFQQCVLSYCLSPRFACYFLLSYDGQRKRVFKTPSCYSGKNSHSSVTSFVRWKTHYFYFTYYVFRLTLFLTSRINLTCYHFFCESRLRFWPKSGVTQNHGNVFVFLLECKNTFLHSM